MPLRITPLCLLWIAIAAGLGAPAAASTLPGPIPAMVERVIDGDTIRVRVQAWIDVEVSVSVRLRGIDAPELRARCEAERAGAEAARDFVTALLGQGAVTLHAVSRGKYSGRVIADVTVDGVDLAAALLAAGHARPYDGGARAGWCGAQG